MQNILWLENVLTYFVTKEKKRKGKEKYVMSKLSLVRSIIKDLRIK